MSRIGPVDRSNRFIVPLSELDAALETIRSSAASKLELGKRFERLMCRVLLEHPGEFRDRFRQVVPWDEWEGRDGPDKGIDLVATDVDGDRWAIQTKCYRDARAPESKVDSFLAEANTASFQRRLFISTSRASPPVTKNAAKKLKGAGCRVLYHGDLAQWPVPWTDLVGDPEAPIPSILYDPHPYQQDAIDAVEAGFGAGAARGQMLLPCGTGKSVVALWIAEQIVPDGGTVLYVVPSISLLGQTMREWASQRRTVQTYVGVCSDKTAGQRGGSESADLTELSIPVTTDPDRIAEALGADRPAGGLKVVFSTYQSLDRVAKAQEMAGADFDLVICDEAHRTTGVEAAKEEGKGFSEDDGAAEASPPDVEAEKDDGKVSPFLLVHDDKKIKARRRLYMTATPRLYTKHAKKKLNQKTLPCSRWTTWKCTGRCSTRCRSRPRLMGGGCRTIR
ncbi:MAG: DEAD/DEAH box helicase family protein [bacterium]|nr:DEAD/DEAH box helicase family protein [bacterium]